MMDRDKVTNRGQMIVGPQLGAAARSDIVQAWRAADWSPGVYSIVRYQLTDDGAGTRLVFDHTGFPVGQAEHLAAGWKANYWEPLRRFLA
jgi:activator of HSP90 ATPase